MFESILAQEFSKLLLLILMDHNPGINIRLEGIVQEIRL